MNPFPAMVEKTQHHRWSSVHANLARREDSLVTPHPCFITMENTLMVCVTRPDAPA
jgi:putative transposase